MIWFLMWACSTQPDPRWTRSGAMAPTLARIDDDQDGRVGPHEWSTRAYATPSFSDVDLDGDGAVSADELWQLQVATDPLRFDGDKPRRSPSPDDEATSFPFPAEARHDRDLLLFLAAELGRPGPSADIPGRDEIEAAVRSGGLGSPSAQALLLRLEAGYLEAGMAFPPGLLREVP